MKDIDLIRATEAVIAYHEKEGNVLCADHFKKQLEALNEEILEQDGEV